MALETLQAIPSTGGTPIASLTVALAFSLRLLAIQPNTPYLVFMADTTGTYTLLGQYRGQASTLPLTMPIQGTSAFVVPVALAGPPVAPAGPVTLWACPNPTRGLVTLYSSHPGLLRLYDATGRRVAVVGLLVGVNQVALPVPSGAYFWALWDQLGRLQVVR